MKNKKFKQLKGIIAIFAICTLFVGCDLELNEGYEFDPAIDFVDPFDAITAWEWIQTRTKLTSDGKYDGDEMNYFIAAIERADMVEEFNQTATTDRTYLLLNNNAFTGSGDIIQIVTGSATVPAGETPEQTMARANVDKLKHVLRYHIVASYINQVPVLEVFNVDYIFQTLYPGEGGLIAFRRNERYSITVNHANAPLPSTATTQNENVRSHNYVFNNGIGHIIADPVRNLPY